MASPYLGEIRIFAGNFAPDGWEFCDGGLYPIAANSSLFQLIGTTYGGDGQNNFAVPDLRGRIPVHFGTGPGLSTYVFSAQGGAEQTTLTTQQIPSHTHPALASTGPGDASNPQGRVVASPPGITAFIQDAPSIQLPPHTVTPAGGSQPHENRMPFVSIHYIIAFAGIFPSPT